jgi:hypothetical protein
MIKSKKQNAFIKTSLERLNRWHSQKRSPLLSKLKVRSERKFAIFKVLEILISGMDLETFAYGMFFVDRHGNVKFYTRGIKFFKEKSGLGERRIERAMHDVVKCMYISSKRNGAIGKDGKLVRHFSHRVFSKKFFLALGFKANTISEAMNWKRKDNDARFGKSRYKAINDLLNAKNKVKTFVKSEYKKIKSSTTKVYKKTSEQKVKNNIAEAMRRAAISGLSPSEELRLIQATE